MGRCRVRSRTRAHRAGRRSKGEGVEASLGRNQGTKAGLRNSGQEQGGQRRAEAQSPGHAAGLRAPNTEATTGPGRTPPPVLRTPQRCPTNLQREKNSSEAKDQVSEQLQTSQQQHWVPGDDGRKESKGRGLPA